MEKDLSISYAKATILGIFLPLPIALLFLWLYLYFWGPGLIIVAMRSGWFLLILLLFIIIGSILHEAIHGFTWTYLGNKPFRSIRYGIHWKSLSPYAHCPEPIDIHAYRIGGLMPCLIEGLIPSLMAIIIGSGWLLFFGLIFTMGAGGDLVILWTIRKVDSGILVRDHPSRVGCSVIIPEPPSSEQK
jgi:hypothetical protein